MGASESKLRIREMAEELRTSSIPPEREQSWWAPLWEAPANRQEVFTLITQETVRQIVEKQPQNISLIIEQLVTRIEACERDLITEYQGQIASHLLNSIRCLTRILSVRMETSQENAVLDETLLERTAEALLRALFVPQVTVDALSSPSTSFMDYVWTAGVVVHKAKQVDSFKYDIARAEVLDAILVLSSAPMFTSPLAYPEQLPHRAALALVAPRELSRAAAVSMLNTVLRYDDVGWGIPYGQHVVSGGERERVTVSALQVFLVLSDPFGTYKHGVSAFSDILHDLDDEKDIPFFLENVLRLLMNHHNCLGTYLPGSQHRIVFSPEMLLLYFRAFETRSSFSAEIGNSAFPAKAVFPVLYWIHESGKSPQALGIVHICAFLLLHLTAERDICVALNSKLSDKEVFFDLNSSFVSYADVYTLVMFRLFVDGPGRIESLHHCLLSSLANVSACLKSLSPAPAAKLVRLLELLAAPANLFCSPHAPERLCFMLEIVNNIVQYHYEGNTVLVYLLLRRRRLFEALNALPFVSPDSGYRLPAALRAEIDALERAQGAPGAPAPSRVDAAGSTRAGGEGSGEGSGESVAPNDSGASTQASDGHFDGAEAGVSSQAGDRTADGAEAGASAQVDAGAGGEAGDGAEGDSGEKGSDGAPGAGGPAAEAEATAGEAENDSAMAAAEEAEATVGRGAEEDDSAVAAAEEAEATVGRGAEEDDSAVAAAEDAEATVGRGAEEDDSAVATAEDAEATVGRGAEEDDSAVAAAQDAEATADSEAAEDSATAAAAAAAAAEDANAAADGEVENDGATAARAAADDSAAAAAAAAAAGAGEHSAAPGEAPDTAAGAEAENSRAPAAEATAVGSPSVAHTDVEHEREGAGAAEGTAARAPAPFVPTVSWAQEWRQKMPLGTILCLLRDLVPRVERICRLQHVVDEDEVIRFLASTTMAGVLPVPHAIMKRLYQPLTETHVWLTTFLWGQIIVQPQSQPLFDLRKAKLFSVVFA